VPSNSGRRPAAAARSDHRNNPGSPARAASDGRGQRIPSEPRVRSQQGTRAAREGPGRQGGPPSDKPDVFLHVPDVHVGEIYLDVEDLDAHLSLQAKLANLVQLVAGVHVHIGKVELDIKDVEAQALLKVRLENLYQILDRALTTVDRNPEILQGLLNTVDSAVDNVGETAKQAVQPGGAVSELAGDVGEVGKEALGPGGAAAEAVGTVGGTAQEAVKPGGAVSQAAEGVTDTASSAVQPGGVVSEATTAVGDIAEETRGTASDVAKTAGDGVRDSAQLAPAGEKPKRRGSPEGRSPRAPKRGGKGTSDTSQERRKGRRTGRKEAGS
jgi:hypothetical protein